MIVLSAALLFATVQANSAEAIALSKAANKAQDAYLQCSAGPNGEINKLLPTNVTPEEGAKIVLQKCAAEREAARKIQYEQIGAMFAPDMAAKARANAKKADANTERMLAADIRAKRTDVALNQCVNSEIAKLNAGVTPEAGADTIFSACAAQRQASLKNMLALMQLRQMTDEWSLAMVKQVKNQIANTPTEVAAAKEEFADRIRMKRKGPPGPPPAKK